jgi:hypothetical protein
MQGRRLAAPLPSLAKLARSDSAPLPPTASLRPKTTFNQKAPRRSRQRLELGSSSACLPCNGFQRLSNRVESLLHQLERGENLLVSRIVSQLGKLRIHGKTWDPRRARGERQVQLLECFLGVT